MKTLPKSLYFTGAAGLSLLLVGDLYNSIGFLVCAVGGILLLWAFVWAVLLFCRHASQKVRRIARIVKIFTFTAIFAFLVSFVWIEGLISTHDEGTERPTAQTLILLGAGLDGERPSRTLIARMQTALAYLQQNPKAVVIVTGGQGAGETITEAEAMHRWLTARGIDGSRIYREEQATDTRENLRYSKEIIERENLPQPVAVVSNSFHLYRAQKLAEQAGFSDVQTLSAPVPDVPLQWLTASVYLREYCSILLMFARNIL